MTATWGASEWVVVIMFGLGGVWIASKLLGLIWRVIRAPFVALFYYFVDDRVFAGVNRLEDDDEDMSSQDDGEALRNNRDNVVATTATTQQQPIATPTTDNNALLFQQQVEDAASMVEAGVCGETKALQIIFKVRPSSSNQRYLAARDALHAELEKRKGAPTPIAGRISSAQFRSKAS